VTTAYLPPHIVRALPEQVAQGTTIPLRLLVGVEPLNERPLYKVCESASVVNGYGPTEATVYSTIYSKDLQDLDRNLPIGRPISNTQIYILDENLSLVPAGVAGEIHIAGVGLARGYLNRPDMTAEKFIPNPFDEPGGRMYKTGDLGRYLPDGNIEFLGRIDHQVKIRGFRIELGEIESALLHCEGVREAVVMAREDSPGDKRLVAYVVAKEPGRIVANDLRALLQVSLPEYMIPASWVFLHALPLNANGKIDRKALPAPEASRADLDVEYVPPRTPTEELLVGIWAEVLKVDRVGIHDNFFALGGHSLLAMQVISRLKEQGRVDVPIKALFDSPTVSALATRAEVIMARRSNDGGSMQTIRKQQRGTLPHG
jgi:acyl-coenzyme A synthetase/AMP-(fatty) acid ligase/acyl carrier protein